MTVRSWQFPFLGLKQFPPTLSDFEIRYFFGLNRDERLAINTRRGELLRIAAVVHIGFIRMTGRTLDAFDRIPPTVLAFVGQQLNVTAPELSTLRALYRWETTLFEHQAWAAKQLAFRPYNDRRQRVLTTQLKREATKTVLLAELQRYAKRWLYDRKILLPSRRKLDRLVRRMWRDADREALREIQEVVPENIRAQWYAAVLNRRSSGETYLEWLQTPPGKRNESTLKAMLEKLDWLKALKVDQYDLSSIRLVRQRHHARKIRWQEPLQLRTYSEPRRSTELSCFLRITLLHATDVIVSLIEMKVLSIQRAVIDKAKQQMASVLPNSRVLLRRIRCMLEDDSLGDSELRSQLLEVVPNVSALSNSRAAYVRCLLSEPRSPVRRLLKLFLVLDFESHNANLMAAVDYLCAAYLLGHQKLPKEIAIEFAPLWHDLLLGQDRRRALRAFEAAVM